MYRRSRLCTNVPTKYRKRGSPLSLPLVFLSEDLHAVELLPVVACFLWIVVDGLELKRDVLILELACDPLQGKARSLGAEDLLTEVILELIVCYDHRLSIFGSVGLGTHSFDQKLCDVGIVPLLYHHLRDGLV